MKKLLLVDLDDTLCNSTEAYNKAQEACFSFLKKYIPRLSKKRFNELYQESRGYVHKNLKGTASSHNRLLYFQRMLEILEFPSDPEFLQDNLADIYWQTTYKNLKLFPGVEKTLKTIYESKIEMGLVSNLLTEIQIKKMETLKIAKYFDFIVCSEEIGREKPFSSIFKLALKKAKCGRSSQVYVIGDNYDMDIIGANRMGFTSIHFNDSKMKRANYSINNFSDLLNILEIGGDGYIKFNSVLKKCKPLKTEDIRELNKVRDYFFKKKLIGMYQNGIGFGNVSCRHGKDKFIISGSATGGFRRLSVNHYSLILDWNFRKNQVICSGKIDPSSETMSHIAVYNSSPSINTIVHIHDNKLWKKLKNKVPTTNLKATYGTPEMAFSIKNVLKKKSNREQGVLVMGGHQDGLILFGKYHEELVEKIDEFNV
jgi:FMN phosphatase YigB (HAD superfamily)